MPRCTFFNRRPVKYGSIAGTITFCVGTGVSIAIALYFSSLVSKLLHGVIAQIGTEIYIPTLTGSYINERNQTKKVTLSDITTPIPQEVLNAFNQIDDKLPQYCFYGFLLLGLSLTTIASLSVATSAASLGEHHDRKEDEERISGYSILTNA